MCYHFKFLLLDWHGYLFLHELELIRDRLVVDLSVFIYDIRRLMR